MVKRKKKKRGSSLFSVQKRKSAQYVQKGKAHISDRSLEIRIKVM